MNCGQERRVLPQSRVKGSNADLHRIGLVDRRLSFENLFTVFLDLRLSVLSTNIPGFGGDTWSTNLPQQLDHGQDD